VAIIFRPQRGDDEPVNLVAAHGAHIVHDRPFAAGRHPGTQCSIHARAQEAHREATNENHRGDRARADGGDATAALASGAIPEYADQAAAQEALKRGEKPETNPAYEQALAEATSAHATLTTCMPHWPVVF